MSWVVVCWFGFVSAPRLDEIQALGAVRCRAHVCQRVRGLSDWRVLGPWEMTAYIVTGLAWTVAGLIDLALLVKFLPRRAEEDKVCAGG